MVTDPDYLWLVSYFRKEEEMEECWSATYVLSAFALLAAASAAFRLCNYHFLRKYTEPMMTQDLVVKTLLLAGGVLDDSPTDGDLEDDRYEYFLGRVPLRKLL